jgi:hypothetical protein
MPSIVTRGAMSAQGFGFAQGKLVLPLSSWIFYADSGSPSTYQAYNAFGKSVTNSTTGQLDFVQFGLDNASKFNILSLDPTTASVNKYIQTTISSSASGYSYLIKGFAADNTNYYYLNNNQNVSTFIGAINKSSNATSIVYNFQLSPNLGYTVEYYQTTNYVKHLVLNNGYFYFMCAINYTNAGCCCPYYRQFAIVKVSTSGTLSYAHYYNTSSTYFNFLDSAFDTSGNIYVSLDYTSPYQVPLLLSLNSSGGSNWAIVETVTSHSNYGLKYVSMGIDTINNVYYVGYGGLSANAITTSRNSSGTLQWSRILNFTPSVISDFPYARSVTDSSGNTYALFNNGASANGGFVLVKYNSSGTIQWQRSMKVTYTGSGGISNAYFNIFDISLDYTNNEVVISAGVYDVYCGGCLTANSGFILKLPTDGSKTGTTTFSGVPVSTLNVTFTYAASSYTDSNNYSNVTSNTYSWPVASNFTFTGGNTVSASVASFSQNTGVTIL